MLAQWEKVSQERFHLIVILKIFSLPMCMIFVIIILWPSECYLTVFVLPKNANPSPSPGLRLRVGGWGTPLSDAGWSDWLVWSCTCWRSYWKTLQSFDQITSNLSFELLFEWQGTSSSGKMVDKFVGTWKMTSSDNFDEYMKAIGMILHHLILY